jgi:hypothetical protein
MFAEIRESLSGGGSLTGPGSTGQNFGERPSAHLVERHAVAQWIDVLQVELAVAMSAPRLSFHSVRERSGRERDKTCFFERATEIADEISHRPAAELAAKCGAHQPLPCAACLRVSHGAALLSGVGAGRLRRPAPVAA